jgi:hypothetical protein
MSQESVIAQLWCCAICHLVSLVGTDYRQQKSVKRQNIFKGVLFILQQLYLLVGCPSDVIDIWMPEELGTIATFHSYFDTVV